MPRQLKVAGFAGLGCSLRPDAFCLLLYSVNFHCPRYHNSIIPLPLSIAGVLMLFQSGEHARSFVPTNLGAGGFRILERHLLSGGTHLGQGCDGQWLQNAPGLPGYGR